MLGVGPCCAFLAAMGSTGYAERPSPPLRTTDDKGEFILRRHLHLFNVIFFSDVTWLNLTHAWRYSETNSKSNQKKSKYPHRLIEKCEPDTHLSIPTRVLVVFKYTEGHYLLSLRTAIVASLYQASIVMS